jgi:hypothetical protein
MGLHALAVIIRWVIAGLDRDGGLKIITRQSFILWDFWVDFGSEKSLSHRRFPYITYFPYIRRERENKK